MNSLAEKIRAARRIEVKVGKCTFIGTRATLEEAQVYKFKSQIGTLTDADICRKHIDGWAGVRASDVLDGAPDTEIDFSKEVFSEVIGEKSEWWNAIATEIVADAIRRQDERKENKKK
jgi:hypothetical protein